MYEQGAETLNQFYTLYVRILASLAYTAENVEKMLGLAPWAEPARQEGEPGEEGSDSGDE